MNKKFFFKILGLVLFFFSIGLNFYFYFSLKREQEKIKNPLLPSLKDDYYSERLFFTKLMQQEEQIGEFKAGDGETMYDDRVLLNVPRLSQNPLYPNGCEAASATMLLNYYHIPITIEDFVTKYLPKKEVYEEGGVRYGPNPAKYYAGDPSDLKRGWGCFAPVIKDSFRNILSSTKYLVADYSGFKISSLEYQLPLLVWITTDYLEATEIYEWTDKEENKTYTYPKNAHVVVLIGFDQDYYYINDPLKPLETQKITKEQFEKSFDSLGRQALGLIDTRKYDASMEPSP